MIYLFEMLKERAKAACCKQVEARFLGGKPSEDVAVGVITLTKTRAARAKVRDEVDSICARLPADNYDDLATAARSHEPFAMLFLLERERELERIAHLDVRQSGELLQRYPDILPRYRAGQRFRCDILEPAEVPRSQRRYAVADSAPWALLFN